MCIYILYFVPKDIAIGGMNQMPKTMKLIVNNGMTFKNGFVSSPVCCVSRSSIMSGRYVHNHGTVNNSINGNCSSKYWQNNIEPTCFAPIVQNQGYNTFYAGKYLNQYGSSKVGGTQWIPKGWTEWKGLVGNSKYYNYDISDNGQEVHHGSNYATDYYTDLIKNQSLQFISQYGPNKTAPMMLVMGTPAAHAKFTPAPQYNITNETALRTQNYNFTRVNQDNIDTKHSLLGKLTPISDQAEGIIDYIYSQRHGTLLSVDDMIEAIYNALDKMGELNNTYWIYTADNGFHSGQFGMGWDKRQLYEEDIRVPFAVAGPGIAKGVVTDKIAVNIDLAPTIIELATGDGSMVPDYMDGQSLVPWLMGKADKNETEKQQFLVHYNGEGNGYQDTQICADVYPKVIEGWSNYCDSWNNTYDCVRMIDKGDKEVNGTIYCQFKCFGPGKVEVECDDDGTAQVYGEYYELDSDYFEINNGMKGLNNNTKKMYDQMLETFVDCKGQSQCNSLRQG